jgi:Na+/proline symporter
MLVGVGVYVLLQLALSVWAARKTKSETDYLLAGRSLGPIAVGMSIFATWFAVEGIVATSGVVAIEGVGGALFDPVGLGLGILLFALLVAGPLRRGGHVMLSGFLGSRFGRSTEAIAGLIVCASAIIWSSVQLLALAVLLVSLADVPLFAALVTATGVVLAYTLLGGLLGDIYTDVLQGIVLVVGLGLVFAVVVGYAGGLDAALAAIPAERLAVRTPVEALTGVEVFLAALATSLASAELSGRVLGARSVRAAQGGALFGGLLYLAVGTLPVLFGLIGPQLGVDLPEGDGYLPAMVEALMPAWLRMIFIGALLSAIFSTVDSALLSTSAVITETGYRSFRPNPSPREGLIAARITTVSAGLLAFLIAAGGDTIRTLAVQAASVGGCLLVPVLAGVLTRSGGQWGAPAAMVGGFVLLLWLEWVRGVTGAFVYAIGGALLFYVAAELLRTMLGRPGLTAAPP